ncbi:uncharacterized protein PGTG_11336 [Puccinia graminis f. sp. tritici CRL 75-36-700-3]|uniref:Uncharacterized protein n=1 Tax=Puccinia graminis f. sp. tritici (strain CRL 75-36-700-3 / race SCCL) TaxID=418459 RepID=E3KLJ2_PUCGT|nr:uncharacterized protein PGTG_11336 [Puccinia graminis f. sp. tritici CRL 75-36-700-3]EFP85167.2 hypothetical protein PGTG_11336 [Puccinia graminis f. sp. tritici CRL 75-36-700-3]
MAETLTNPCPSKEGSLGWKVESKKHGKLVKQQVLVPLSIDPSPKHPPLTVSVSQECLDSYSTSKTSTQLLFQTIKLDLKKAKRLVVRLPFGKVFHHLPGSLFSSFLNHRGQASPMRVFNPIKDQSLMGVCPPLMTVSLMGGLFTPVNDRSSMGVFTPIKDQSKPILDGGVSSHQ